MKTRTAPDAGVSAPSGVATASWLTPLLANAVIWGSSFLFIKVAVERVHPTWVAAGRLTVGAVTVLAIMTVMGHRLPSNRSFWLHMLVPGVVGSTIPFTLFGYGEERVSSLVAGIWNATTALWVLPVAVLVFRTERFTTRKAVGLAIGFAGVLTVLGFWHSQGASSMSGQLMCAAAAACYAVAIPYLKRFVTGRGVSGVTVAAGQLIVGATASIVAALVIGGAPTAVSTLSWPVIGSVLALGVFGSGLAFVMHTRVISLAGASTAAVVTYLVPLVATALGVVVLNESLTWNLPVGAAIVLAGVAVAQGLFGGPRRSPSIAPTVPGTAPGVPVASAAMAAPAAVPSGAAAAAGLAVPAVIVNPDPATSAAAQAAPSAVPGGPGQELVGR